MFSLVPFMILDGFLLYAVILGFAIIELIAMEQDRPGMATGILIVALVVLQFCSTVQPLSFAYHHPVHALIIAGGYFAIGSIWIILKWFSHVYKIRDQFNAIKQDCINQLNQDYFLADGSLTEDGKKKVYRIAAIRLQERDLPLQVSEHKGEIYMWWLCWPLSSFWTVLNDPITRLWNFVYSLFGNWMQRISDRSIDLK
jgi:hypothetical protein